MNRNGWIVVAATVLMGAEVAFVPYLDRYRGDWIGGPVLLLIGIALILIQLSMLPLLLATKRRRILFRTLPLLLPLLYSYLFLARFARVIFVLP